MFTYIPGNAKLHVNVKVLAFIFLHIEVSILILAAFQSIIKAPVCDWVFSCSYIHAGRRTETFSIQNS